MLLGLRGGASRLRTSCIVPLRRGEAGEKEAEEGVGVGVEADLRIGRVRWNGSVGDVGGVGRAGVGARKTLFVDADMHGLDGTESGIDEEGDGHGVEESGCFLAPLMVEESKGVGDGSALAEEEGALDLVELELGGVEGHDEETHPGGEELLCGRDVVEAVPFGLWRMARAAA